MKMIVVILIIVFINGAQQQDDIQHFIYQLVNVFYPSININVLDSCRILHIPRENYLSIFNNPEYWQSTCLFSSKIIRLLDKQLPMKTSIDGQLDEMQSPALTNDYTPMQLWRTCAKKNFLNGQSIEKILALSIRSIPGVAPTRFTVDITSNSSVVVTHELWITDVRVPLFRRSMTIRDIFYHNIMRDNPFMANTREQHCNTRRANDCPRMDIFQALRLGTVLLPRSNRQQLTMRDWAHHVSIDHLLFESTRLCSHYRRQLIKTTANTTLVIECPLETRCSSTTLIHYQGGTVRLERLPLITLEPYLIVYSIDRPLTCPFNQKEITLPTIVEFLTKSSEDSVYFRSQFSFINPYAFDHSVLKRKSTEQQTIINNDLRPHRPYHEGCISCANTIYPLNLTFSFFAHLVSTYWSTFEVQQRSFAISPSYTFVIIPDQYLTLADRQNPSLDFLRRHLLMPRYFSRQHPTFDGRLFLNDRAYIIEQFDGGRLRTGVEQEVRVKYDTRNDIVTICIEKEFCRKALYTDLCLSDGVIHIIDGHLPLEMNIKEIRRQKRAVDQTENKNRSETFKYIMAIIPMIVNSFLVILVNYCFRPDNDPR